MVHKLNIAEKQAHWASLRPPRRFPIAGVLDNIRSAYNVGAMFRTAECAYISELLLCGITAQPPHPEVEKTALGTTKILPWRYFPDTLEAVKALKSEGWHIAALEITEVSLPIQAVQEKNFPLALVMGNELSGVDERVLAAADLVVEIPQYGQKESLNVAVAFGVAVFLLLEKAKLLYKPSTEGLITRR